MQRARRLCGGQPGHDRLPVGIVERGDKPTSAGHCCGKKKNFKNNEKDLLNRASAYGVTWVDRTWDNLWSYVKKSKFGFEMGDDIDDYYGPCEMKEYCAERLGIEKPQGCSSPWLKADTFCARRARRPNRGTTCQRTLAPHGPVALLLLS